MKQIQIGWAVHRSHKADFNFFCQSSKLPSADVTWYRQELGWKMGVFDYDDLVIEYLPNRRVTESIPWNALEAFTWLNGGPNMYRLSEEQVKEFLAVLKTRLANSLKE